MKVCIFGAASAHIDKKYIDLTEELGEKLARRGHSLVFGCGATGLMGAAARGFSRGGGNIHGVIPEFFRENGIEQIYGACNKITYTKTMAERKKTMEDEADCFIVTPGGVGTFEEFFEVLTLKQLGRHDKAIAVFNIDGYYDDLESFMEEAIKRQFITDKCHQLYGYFATADQVIDYIENYTPQGTPWQKLKIGD